MKLNIIIDACSYIYLHQSNFTVKGKQHSLFSFFKKFVNLHQSKVVHGEIARNYKGEEKVLIRGRRNYQFEKQHYKLEDYDEKLFNGEIKNQFADAGEKANLAVAIDMLICKKRIGLIFLSDDKKAISDNSKLNQIFRSFPYFPTWTSFEVILFLYLTGMKKGFTYNIALGAIKDLNNFLFKIPREQILEKRKKLSKSIYSNDEYSIDHQNLQSKVINQELLYRRRLEIIRTLIDK